MQTYSWFKLPIAWWLNLKQLKWCFGKFFFCIDYVAVCSCDWGINERNEFKCVDLVFPTFHTATNSLAIFLFITGIRSEVNGYIFHFGADKETCYHEFATLFASRISIFNSVWKISLKMMVISGLWIDMFTCIIIQ